ncbi:CHC2 zinc finger domain-containing protein [Thiolapillus sp.]|uniref:CHC2 zinc finger domain-containing protein n=21 Tax=Thiolapillus sp. TaxID=2017437 RepID=UPI0025E532FF|nr:CHC2 zinc finger domain-containing protein [Thiolapillus sp.]
MARIPNNELDRLKREVALVRLVESSGIELKKHGKDYLGLCPFHDDKEPSLVISPDKNLWHCLGACNEGGDVIQWVMKRQGVSFRHAVELLKGGDAALSVPATPVKRNTTAKHSMPLAADPDDQKQLAVVIDYYHDTLKQSPDALEYLNSRGLGGAELIDCFKLGYANRTLGYRLPARNRKAGAEVRGQLQRVGILRNTGHEHFSGSLVVPVIDGDGLVTEVYGRKILGKRLRKGTPQHLYLPGAHQGVWNAAALADSEEVILCEALIDAMTFWVNGYRNVTASYGTSGFTEDHLTVFKQANIKRVLIAYDRDEAGNTAAVKLAEQLQAEGFACYRLHFPKGMDANAYALEVRPANKSLGVVIRSAEWMGDGRSGERASDLTSLDPAERLATDGEAGTLRQGRLLGTSSNEANTLPPLAAESQPQVEEPQVKIEAPSPKPETPPLPAAAVPPAPENPEHPEVTDHEINIEYGNRHYRVRGLQKNSSYEVMKVNVLVKVGEVIHVDTFDLYSAKHRQAFARVAATECGIEDKTIQRDLGKLLLQLEGLQDKAIQEALQPKEPTGYTMEDTEREQALTLLKDNNLAGRIIEDFAKTGLVGEPSNALMGYLACVSRKLNMPLAIIVQSTSAAGKSALMDAVLKLVPEEDRVHYSAMTGQSLFYLGESDLKHKILGIAEEEGVRQAAYALKLLQSQGELTIASTGKDPESGKLVTEEYRVEGPVMLFLTTTAIDIDEELLNRCVVLSINESREQTAAIQQRQRQARTLSGLLARNESEHIIQQHQNAQRLLRPLAVVNPYAEQLAFADSRTRTRRDHEKYLTLIDSITLLYQYQRDIKTIDRDGQVIEYVEATLDDIALANQLAHDILGHSLDELPPPTRQLLQHLHTLVANRIKAENLQQNEVRFTRRDIREISGLSNSQVSIHLDRLVELEYVYAHHGKNGQRYVYELVFDGELTNEQPQLIGLIDVEQLKKRPVTETMTDNLTVSNGNLPHSFRAASGNLPGSFRTPETGTQPSTDKALAESDLTEPENALIRQKNNAASHRSSSIPLAASAEVQ